MNRKIILALVPLFFLLASTTSRADHERAWLSPWAGSAWQYNHADGHTLVRYRVMTGPTNVTATTLYHDWGIRKSGYIAPIRSNMWYKAERKPSLVWASYELLFAEGAACGCGCACSGGCW
jgi:hypothetical protein